MQHDVAGVDGVALDIGSCRQPRHLSRTAAPAVPGPRSQAGGVRRMARGLRGPTVV